MPSTIAIFPAAGGLGGATLTHLLNTSQIDPSSLVLVARHPEKLAEESKKGVDVRKGDFDHLESLQKGVFRGVDALNLISYPSFEHEHRFEVSGSAGSFIYSSGSGLTMNPLVGC
jgi:uncharacterized protein YbjT (DUF2867 family)